MSASGLNEPVDFTRGDAERLKALETTQTATHTIVGTISTKLDIYHDNYTSLKETVNAHIRIVKVVKRIGIWLITGGSGATIIAVISKLAGWIT